MKYKKLLNIFLLSIVASLLLVSCGGGDENTPSLLEPGETKKETTAEKLGAICEKYSTSYTEALGILTSKVADNQASINIIIQTNTYLEKVNKSSETFLLEIEALKVTKTSDKENFQLITEQMEKILNVSNQLIAATEPVLEDNEVTAGEFESFSEATNTVSEQINIHSDTIDTVIQKYDFTQGECNAWSNQG